MGLGLGLGLWWPTKSSLIAGLIASLRARSTYFENKNCTKATLQDLDDVNLLEKASIVTTPTAYNDGSLNSIKPEQNLGNEEVNNGDFTTDTGWTKGAGWTIANGIASLTAQGVSSNLGSTVMTVTSGNIYKVVIDVISTSTGFRLYDTLGVVSYGLSVGKNTFYRTVSSTSYQVTPLGLSGASGSIESVSVKEVIGADFDFQRGSAATRVNSQGLIENVQTLSGNLVQNGDFSEIGSELVTNGDFATDSDWIFSDSNSTSISSGTLNVDGSQSSTVWAYQSAVNSGKTYKFTYTISSLTSGEVRAGLSGVNGTWRNSLGTYTEYLTPTSGLVYLYFNSDFIGSIDNVSVKEVGQNWTIQSGTVNITDKAEFVGSGIMWQDALNINKSYKVTYEVISIVGSPNFNLYNGSWFSAPSTVGTHTVYMTNNTGFPRFYLRNTSSGEITIDNISAIEVTDDTNLPRIDYTDGCGSLLLEPQSTNTYLNSEPTTNEGSMSGVTYESFNWVIGFTNCVKYEDNSATIYRYGGTISASTEYTLSAFVIMDDLSEPIIGGLTSDKDFSFVLGGSVVNPNPSVNMGNNIWRVSSTAITSASPAITNNGIIKYTAQSNKGFRVVGYQVEQQSYPTSYIPTNGSTVTRNADVCNNAGSSDLINSTEGVLYAEISANENLSGKWISLSNGTTSERVSIAFQSDDIRLYIRNASGLIWDYTYTNANIFDYNKIGLKYKSEDYALWINGIEVSTDSNSNLPSGLNSLQFDSGGGTSNFYGNVKSVVVFKEALTNDELEGLTGEGYDTFNALALANNYTII